MATSALAKVTGPGIPTSPSTASTSRDQGVLPGDLVGRLQDLTGLRNRLVHLYDDVDDSLVHQALAAGLTDLEDFATAVARLLASDDG